MGQANANPTAQAAKRGELSEADRVARPKTPTHTETYIVPGGMYLADGYGTLSRKLPKARGKAAVKVAKRVRHAKAAAS